MASSSKVGKHRRLPVPAIQLKSPSAPTTIPVLDLAPVPAVTAAIPLIPDHVPEPEYVLRGNKVACTWCGTKLKTRRKYIAHFNRRHLHG